MQAQKWSEIFSVERKKEEQRSTISHNQTLPRDSKTQ